VRHLKVVVPSDCVAAIHDDLAQSALQMMSRNMRAELTEAAEVEWEDT